MNEPKNAIGGAVGFFEVPLVCAAAPHLGCGTLAKPILSEIEKQVSVQEAWLNRQGTVLAVIWAARSDNRAATERLLSILRKCGLKATKLEGSDLHQAMASFSPGHDWHRAMQIDRLSEEEALVIATRLVRRLGQSVALTDVQAAHLTEALGGACERILTDTTRTSASERLDQIAATLPGVATELLDDASLAVFREVVGFGHRPLLGEA